MAFVNNRKGFEIFYSEVTRAALSTVREAVIIEGTKALRQALRDMDKQLEREFHKDMTKVVRALIPKYRAMTPTSAPKGRRHYPGGQRKAASMRPWGQRTVYVPGGMLKKSLVVRHNAKGVRVITGKNPIKGDMWYAQFPHYVRRRSRSGRIIQGNPYLWRARRVTRPIVEAGVERILKHYISIVDRKADGKGP